MHLFFPQWQGSGNTQEVFTGAMALYEHFKEQFDFTPIPVSTENSLQIEQGIFGYREIVSQLQAAQATIKRMNPQTILVIGGDCGVEVAPVTFLNKQYRGNLTVLWFDAHGDLQMPDTSLSHAFHGMPLRVILGEGDPEILKWSFSTLARHQIVLVGTRDLDPPEKVFMQQNQIAVFSADQINAGGQDLIRTLQNRGFDNAYIHLDLDVLDPQFFPYVKCPTPEGVRVETLIGLLRQIKQSVNIVGFSVVEYTCPHGKGLEVIERLIQAGFR
jgi:arginase